MGDMPQSAPGAVLPNVSKGSARGAVRPGRYAAIDSGTVTCRMLVADIDEEVFCASLIASTPSRTSAKAWTPRACSGPRP